MEQLTILNNAFKNNRGSHEGNQTTKKPSCAKNHKKKINKKDINMRKRKIDDKKENQQDEDREVATTKKNSIKDR